MVSIVPGYRYDIFFSYRQKGNKHDNCVKEFVANPNKELKTTFEENIGVYYFNLSVSQ